MYIDVGVIIVLLVLVLFFFKRFSSFVYAYAIIDIFLRILTFIKNNTVSELRSLIGRIFPENIPSIICKYTDGIIQTILLWGNTIIFIIFLFYITSYFIQKRR